jgi:hypothetical protein
MAGAMRRSVLRILLNAATVLSLVLLTLTLFLMARDTAINRGLMPTIEVEGRRLVYKDFGAARWGDGMTLRVSGFAFVVSKPWKPFDLAYTPSCQSYRVEISILWLLVFSSAGVLAWIRRRVR